MGGAKPLLAMAARNLELDLLYEDVAVSSARCRFSLDIESGRFGVYIDVATALNGDEGITVCQFIVCQFFDCEEVRAFFFSSFHVFQKVRKFHGAEQLYPGGTKVCQNVIFLKVRVVYPRGT